MKFFLLSVLFVLNALGVDFPVDLNQNPPEIEWKKIDTEHFEIIFPLETLNQAKRVAQLLEAAYPHVSKTLEVYPKKISLILQNQGTISNAFVTLAPRRSEWYLSPSINPELTSTEWLKTLAIHEFRHVVQFEKTRQNFNRWYDIFLGEIGQALGLGLSLPPWYLEGDAVGIETALTRGGRGRLPLFERDLRTLLLAGKKFSYDKAHLGSLKDYVPNHYVYGYFYTSLMRERYGDYFLSHLANESTRDSYYPLTFYNAFEKLTKQKFEDFYTHSLRELSNSWQQKQDQLKPTPINLRLDVKRDGWTNYSYPQFFDNKLIALKTGLGNIPQFIKIDNKSEEVVFYPGPLVNEYPFKVRNNRMAFNEWEIDPRWGMRDFSCIKVWDFSSNKIITDIRKTKSRLATLDHLGQKILTVDWSSDQKQLIRMYTLQGEISWQYEMPFDEVITSLDWLDNNNIVLVVRNYEDKKSIIELNLNTNQKRPLLALVDDNLGAISVSEGEILVESPQSGIDNIFHLTNKGLVQLTKSKHGAYAPIIKDNKLIYNDYSVHGMQIVEKQLPWDDSQVSADSFIPVYEKYSKSENKYLFESSLNQHMTYKVQDYSQVKNALNFHSWVLLAPPLSSTLNLAGISRDLLNKFSLTIGASYDLNQRESQMFITSTWSNYYPVFDLRAQYGRRRQQFTKNGQTTEDSWEEGNLETGIQLPWKKIEGRFLTNLTTRFFGKLIKINQNSNPDPHEVNDGTLFSSGLEFDFNLLSRLAARDLNPSLGFSLNSRLETAQDITGNNQTGRLISFDSRIYLPGLFKHHSFFHQIAFERQGLNSYHFASLISKPRGFESDFQEELIKYSSNYFFPIAYPDYNLSRYLYLRRVFGNIFYDQLNARNSTDFSYKSSTGPELSAELFFFRLALPLTLGIRRNFILTGKQDDSFEFFVNTVSTDF